LPLLAALVALAGCAEPADRSDEEIERWREEGRYHFEVTRDLDRAVAALESLTARSPTDVEGLVALGQALATAPRAWERAARLFEAAIALDPGNAEAHSGLFDARARLGDLAAAREVQSRFVRLRPGHPFPLIQAVRLAWLLEDRPAVMEALEALERAFPGDRTVRAWAAEERARIALVDGRLEEADRLFQQALTVAGVRGDAVEIIERAVDRAWALVWWSADTATAVALVDSVTRAHPMASMSMDEWPFHYLAEFQAMAGRPDRAVHILESHASHMAPPADALPNPWWQAAWGLIALDVDRPGEAVERFRLWDEGIGCSICALGDLARALDAAGEPDSARMVWRRYLDSTDPQRIEWDPYYLGLARERLIRASEDSGDAARVGELRRALARQWAGADPRIRRRPSLTSVAR
jgi:tetratricopeptide (TPR) repeat protein